MGDLKLMAVEMRWGLQVMLREQMVDHLLRLCGEYELSRRFGADGRRMRPLSRKIDELIALEHVMDGETFCRPAGEGRPVAIQADDELAR